MTLIQLVSEQTMPNLLAMMRLQPKRVIHLFTKHTKNQSFALKKAADAMSLYPHWQYYELSDMPGIVETFETVRKIHRETETDSTIVLNFTGGTKLMSIGAYAAAQNLKIPSIYVDTKSGHFMDGQTSSNLKTILRDDLQFDSLYPGLSVEVLGIANGINRITEGKDWKTLLPLARNLFENPSEEKELHDAMHGESGILAYGREPQSPAGWIKLMDQPIQVQDSLASAICQTHLARSTERGDEILLPDSTRHELEFLARNHVDDFHQRYFKAVAPLQQSISFLTGSWWETIVCDAANCSGLVRDIHWSSFVGEQNKSETEEDILGLDGVELLYISCKRSGAKARLLPHMQEMCARAASIGGSYNRRYLAIYQMNSEKAENFIRHQASRNGIQLITRNNVYEPNIFAKNVAH